VGVLALAALAAATGGCALPAGPPVLAVGPTAGVVVRTQNPGFGDPVRPNLDAGPAPPHARLVPPEAEPQPQSAGVDDTDDVAQARVGGPSGSMPVPVLSDDPDEAPETATTPPTVVGPGFPDETLILPGPDWERPWGRARSEEGKTGEDQGDTDLGRSRAQRRGEGGGPTRSEEEEDEYYGEEFKSDLLVKLLGLEDSPYNLFGWIQGSYTGNPARPRNGLNFGVNPNYLANTWLFQQLYFVAERPLDPARNDEYHYGFRFDNLFGSDWMQYHMVGLFDGLNRSKFFGWEPVQFFGEVHLPWLTEDGIDVKGGRFFSLGGYEDALAPGRPLNSTGYVFSYAQPFTHFGVMTTWHVTDRLNWFNGAVNGWDRWINARYRWGYAGGIVWDSADSRTNATLTLNVGPNQFPSFFPAHYSTAPNGVPQPPFLAGRQNILYGNNNAVLLTGVLIHQWTERLSSVVDGDFGYETAVPGVGPGGVTTNGAWYGLASWTLYGLTEHLTGVYRAEFFRDERGVRTGFNDTFYEMTLGLIYKPWTWFWVRPEVRWDWANGTAPYDDEKSHNQLTFGFDTIFLF
jgi:hypothetical protein